MTNWIQTKFTGLSIKDKLLALLKIGHKLVLVQKHELERLRISKHKDRNATYINDLYEHYIINKLPKTYLT